MAAGVGGTYIYKGLQQASVSLSTLHGWTSSSSPEPILQMSKPRHVEIKSFLSGGTISDCGGDGT